MTEQAVWTPNYLLYTLDPHLNLDAQTPTVSNTQDANAAMQAHLVGIELLIRKDCLLITHLLKKRKEKEMLYCVNARLWAVFLEKRHLWAPRRQEAEGRRRSRTLRRACFSGGVRHGCKTTWKHKLSKINTAENEKSGKRGKLTSW